MSPFQTAKQNGRRYRYYVPQRDLKEHAGASGLPRMPAAELESAVLEQLRGHLRSPDVVKDVLPQARKYDPTLDDAIVTVAMKRLDDVWDQLFPAEQMRIVRLLVRQVTVSPNSMSMDLHPTGIQQLVLELHHKKSQPEPATQTQAVAVA
jgi:hypothetical protein